MKNGLGIFFSCFLCLSLTGCLSFGSKQSSDQNEIRQGAPPTRAEVLPDENKVPDAVRSGFRDLKNEIQSSNSVTKNDVTGVVGAQFNKVAEKVEASLAKIETHIDTTATANVQATSNMLNQFKAELTVALTASIVANLTANLTANLDSQIDSKVNAAVKAQIDASGIAGIGNKIEKMQQDVTAGRDSNITNFSKEMQDMIEYKDWTMMKIIGGALAILLATIKVFLWLYIRLVNRMMKALDDSRERSEQRFKAMDHQYDELLSYILKKKEKHPEVSTAVLQE